MTLTYCSSEATAGHETFGCLNPDGHAGLHRASVTHGRCPNCGGIEDHADTCPTPDLMEDTSQPMQEVVWGDDGIVRLEPYQPGSFRIDLLTHYASTDGAGASEDPDLAEALQLLDQLATWCPCGDGGERCANTDAHALLVRHGIRKEPAS